MFVFNNDVYLIVKDNVDVARAVALLASDGVLKSVEVLRETAPQKRLCKTGEMNLLAMAFESLDPDQIHTATNVTNKSRTIRTIVGRYGWEVVAEMVKPLDWCVVPNKGRKGWTIHKKFEF